MDKALPKPLRPNSLPGNDLCWLFATLDRVADAVIATDTRHMVLFLNPAAESLLGAREEECIGRPITNILRIADELGAPAHGLEQALKSGHSHHAGRELLLLRQNGTRVPVTYEVNPVLDFEGNSHGASILLRDVSQHREAEAKVVEADQRFRVMADTAPVLVWTSGVDKLCTFFNAEWLRFTGRTMEQEKGNGWLQSVHPEDAPGCQRIYSDCFDARETFSMQYRLRRHDGQYRWVLDHGVPRYDESGTFVGYIGSCLDITDQRLAQETANETEARLFGVVDSAMDAIITVDNTERIQLFNKSAEKIFGYNAGEVLGKSLGVLIPHRYRERHHGQMREFGRTGVTSRSMRSPGVLTGLHADGHEFPIEASISQVTYRGEKLYTVILRDLTEKKNTEAALRRSEKLAATGRLAATIAHEINNPLEAVMNLIYLARIDHAMRDEFLEIAERELVRVAMITRQTLGFYREVSSPIDLRLSELLDEVVAVYGGKIRAKEIHVESTYSSQGLMRGLRGELGQIFANLVSNAVDACRTGGHIRIVVDEVNGMVRTSVSDDGIGIPDENLERIFEPFFTTKESLGTGLGLWVVRDLIEKNGGHLAVRSNTDEGSSGTAFEVVLPKVVPIDEHRVA